MHIRRHLSRRLQSVADLVLAGKPMCDVGSDHGLLPVWLVLAGRVPSALAMDLHATSLARTVDLVARMNAHDRVATRLSDGLNELQSTDKAATATMAGMGGKLIIRILRIANEHGHKVRSVERVVLQPNGGAQQLRAELPFMGWRIVDEELVQEHSHFYPVIAAERFDLCTTSAHDHAPPLDGADLAFGPIIRQKRPEALSRMLRKDARTLERRVHGLLGRDEDALRRAQNALELVHAELQIVGA